MEGIFPDSWRLFSEKAVFVEGICDVSVSQLECLGTQLYAPTLFIGVMAETRIISEL